jgi:hypothetical protein
MVSAGRLRVVSAVLVTLGINAPPPALAAAADRVCPIPTCDPRLIGHRTLRAVMTTASITVDGRLDERAWSESAPATEFMQSRPTPGAAATLHTEARVLVDRTALYIGVRLDDPDPETIVAPFLRRDDEAQSDWVFVEIDSRLDRRSAYSFGLNPRGVQVDGVFVEDTIYDVEWNAIWQGVARIDERGWTAEFRIPLSQIAFASGAADEDRIWGFNIYRYSPARGEASNWSPRFAGLPGVVSQFNDLTLHVSDAPRRLEIAPFAAPRIETTASASAGSVRAGADFSVGLGPSFTLTGTALPDFGQIEADPSQINLTTYELFQTERRPFFVEGAGAFAFNAGTAFKTRGNSFAEETPFYSRRVGRDGASVLGALKLSGRTRDGWSIGALAAVTEGVDVSEEPATLGPERPQPATMTSVVRAVRSFRGGESAVGAIAGVVDHLRMDASTVDRISQRAVVYGIDGRHRFGRQQYELNGWALGSLVEASPAAMALITADSRHGFQRPDTRMVDMSGSRLTGSAAQLRIGRVTGAWLWSATGETITPGFEVNDLGFQRNADWRILKADWRYQRQREGHLIRRWTLGSDSIGIGWSTGGDVRARTADTFVRADLRNYWNASLSWMRDLPALSFEWLRGGPALRLPTRDTLRIVIGSDSRKRSAVILDASAATEPASGSSGVSLDPQIVWRSSDHVVWSLGPSYRRDVVGWQFVSLGGNDRDRPIVARLHQDTVSVITRADVIFDVHALVQVYVQPFISAGQYDRFQQLAAPRATAPADRFDALDGPPQVALPDEAHGSLNATIVFRWEYRPASFVTAVWTHRQEAIAEGRRTLGDAWRGLTNRDGADVFLLKTSLRLGR